MSASAVCPPLLCFPTPLALEAAGLGSIYQSSPPISAPIWSSMKPLIGPSKPRSSCVSPDSRFSIPLPLSYGLGVNRQKRVALGRWPHLSGYPLSRAMLRHRWPWLRFPERRSPRGVPREAFPGRLRCGGVSRRCLRPYASCAPLSLLSATFTACTNSSSADDATACKTRTTSGSEWDARQM